MQVLSWYEPEHLTGIAKWANKAGWTLGRSDLSHPGTLRSWKPDGIISQLHPTSEDLVSFVKSLAVPKVELAGYIKDPLVPVVEPDRHATGRMVADHFVQRKFKNYLLVGSGLSNTPEPAFSEGFREGVEEHGLSITILDTHLPQHARLPDGRRVTRQRCVHDDLSDLCRRRIAREITKLPLPLAVFAPAGIDAVDIVEACHAEGLLIPEQVSIITISGDVAFCELTDPSLTALSPDYHTQAYAAAVLLDRLMDGETPPAYRVYTAPGTLVVRNSTSTLAVENLDVARALRYIATNYHRTDLYAPDIVAATHLSRRALYRAFAESVGHSIGMEIKTHRLKKAIQLLQHTSLPVVRIAQMCGYTDTKHLDRSLKRIAGMTPSEYRRKDAVLSNG